MANTVEIQESVITKSDFKPISLEHKQIFEKISYKVGIYSDFNFNSFYSWNVDGNHAIKIINGNLTARFSDYVTGKPFYSLIGVNEVDKTINLLLELSISEKLEPALKMVPEATVLAIKNPKKFTIIEDRDNFDYVQSIESISTYSGKNFKNKRQSAKRCAQNYDINLSEHKKGSEVVEEIFVFLENWKKEKEMQGKIADIESEYIAISRILSSSDNQDKIKIHIARLEGRIVGFSIDELLPDNFVLSHYFKTDPKIKGLSEYLNMETAKKLLSLGYSQWNWEQDLAINNLRVMKMGYRPIRMQKKYTISKAV